MSKVTRRDFLKQAAAAGVGLSVGSLVGACGPKPTPTTAPAAPTPTIAKVVEQKLRVGVYPIPLTMNPNLDSGATAIACYRAMFDPLFNADRNGNVEPALAESWKILDDTTWEIKLREGVKFHNGEDFDAETVKWNIEWTLNPENKSRWVGRIRQIDRVEVVDKHTLKVFTKGPFGALLQGLMIIFMMPPKYFEDVGADGFANAPVGTGPFMFKEYKVDEYVSFEGFESWQGVPQLKELTFRDIGEKSTLLAALEAGEIDVAWNVLPEHVERLKSKNINIVYTPVGYQMVLWLKHWWPDSPLQDKRVRQALCYGVDVKSIVDNVLLGYGEMLEGQLPGKDCFGYNPNVKAYPYDPEKARALLAEAGYPDGFELDCKNPQEGKYLKSKECWEAAASQLAKIGVKCNIETVEIAMVDKMVTDGTYGPAFFFGWQVMPAMDLHLPLTYCRGDHTFKMIQDETFDRMLDEEAATLDQDERKKKLQEIVEYLHDFVTAIYLFELPGIWGVRPNVRGYDPYPNYRRDFTEISIV